MQEVQFMKALLSVKETAEFCGLSVRSIYSLMAAERFGPEVVRIGRSVKFRLTDLERWVSWGCPTREEYMRKAALLGESA